MTNAERLIGLVGFEPKANTYNGAFIDAGIVGTDEYVPSSLSIILKCAVQVLEVVLSTADYRNENGVSVQYDRNAILKLIDKYTDQTATGPKTPYITAPKVW